MTVLTLLIPCGLSPIGKLYWLKNQDHVRERLWQQLLSYLSCLYHVLAYHQRLSAEHLFPLDQHDTLYVASAAVWDNDDRINPLGRRRFTIIRELAQTPTIQVYEGIDTRPTPLKSIMDHLYCPRFVHDSIGDNIYSFAQSVYLIKDVYARVGLYYPSFVRSFDGTIEDGWYLLFILFLEALLQHYSSHSVLPKYLVHDLATGCFYSGLAQNYWVIHLRKAQAAFQRTASHREYITTSRLTVLQDIPAQSYFDMTDDHLWLVTCTIQQLLVEHALYLNGPMTHAQIQEAEVQLKYQPPSSTSMRINQGDFLMYKSYMLI